MLWQRSPAEALLFKSFCVTVEICKGMKCSFKDPTRARNRIRPAKATNNCRVGITTPRRSVARSSFTWVRRCGDEYSFYQSSSCTTGIRGNMNNFLTRGDCEATCPVWVNPCLQGQPILDTSGRPQECNPRNEMSCSKLTHYCHVGKCKKGEFLKKRRI